MYLIPKPILRVSVALVSLAIGVACFFQVW